MKLIKRNIFAFILGLLAITVHLSAQAEGLILTAPPRETAEKGQKMYSPIAAHLIKTLGGTSNLSTSG